MDRFYDPNGDGVVTDDEIKLWDPHLSPPPVANDRFDNTGDLKRPIIIGHGSQIRIESALPGAAREASAGSGQFLFLPPAWSCHRRSGGCQSSARAHAFTARSKFSTARW